MLLHTVFVSSQLACARFAYEMFAKHVLVLLYLPVCVCVLAMSHSLLDSSVGTKKHACFRFGSYKLQLRREAEGVANRKQLLLLNGKYK